MGAVQLGDSTGYVLELNGRLADACRTRREMLEAVRIFGDHPKLAAFWLDRTGHRHPFDVRRWVEGAQTASRV